MSDYIVDSSELTAIANAIRTKGKITGNLIFPSGFVSAINDLPTPSTDAYYIESFDSTGNVVDIMFSDPTISYGTNITIPSSCKNIRSGAFKNFTTEGTIIFKGTPDSISATAFQNCTGNIAICVPWSEGAIAGAPWGATNATMIYNYEIIYT